MEPPEPHAPARQHAIDLLRCGAALAVVGYHVTYRGYHAEHASPVEYAGLGQVFKYGYLGVELFLLISGYVVLMSAQGDTAGQAAPGAARHLHGRFLRHPRHFQWHGAGLSGAFFGARGGCDDGLRGWPGPLSYPM
jgi:peptidoglycan/LPS O-acetylase OafA/YrhL